MSPLVELAPINQMDILVLAASVIFFIIAYRYVSKLLKTLMILAMALLICVSLADVTSRTLARYTIDHNDIPFFQEFMNVERGSQ